MIKRLLAFPVAVLALFGLVAVFAPAAAQAFPTKTVPCSGCHSGANVPVSATLANTAGTTATYNASAPTADAIAVFDGATKVATMVGASGQFAVPVGKTYTVFAVTGPTTGDGLGSTTVSPVALPPADTTAPTTVSDAKATYADSAVVKLTASDNAGGSGVAHTYYKLDGGAQTEGTTISVATAGAHTLAFWSVDTAGNVEVQKTAAFTVTVTPPADTTAPTTLSDAKFTYADSAVVKLTATDNMGGSGVAHTYYILDSSLQAEGTTINVTSAGSHTIVFWSVDAAGNVESQKTAAFTITVTPPADTTKPITTSDAKATYADSALITLTASDNVGGSGVAHTYYKVDSGLQLEGTTISLTAPGGHSITYWSVDTAGNVETAKSASFTITVTPPPVVPDLTAPITVSNAAASYVGSAAIKLTATDVGGAGVAHTYYVLDASAQAEGTNVAASTVGTHTLEFWSVDAAGNVESPHTTVTFSVTSAPVPSGYTVRVRIAIGEHDRLSDITAMLANRATGDLYHGTMSRRGVVTFTNVPAGTYRLIVTGTSHEYRVRTITVGASGTSSLSSDRHDD